MNYKYFSVPVSVKDNNTRIIEGVIQNDSADIFNIKVYDSGESFDFTGYTDIVLNVMKPDGTFYTDETGVELTTGVPALSVIDAEAGRLEFKLPASLSAQKGMHFCSISIYSNGVKLTTAKFNYFVTDSIGGGDVTGQDEYPVLDQMLAKLSLIEEAEQARLESETMRVNAENSRTSEYTGLVVEAKEILGEAQGYAAASEDWYKLILQAIGQVTEIDLNGIATKVYVDDKTTYIDCGENGSEVKRLQVRRGLDASKPTDLYDGEFYYATDTGLLYIGVLSTPVCLNAPCFIAQATAPSDTGKLWIDTANGNAVKFYNGSEWTGTAQGTFA